MMRCVIVTSAISGFSDSAVLGQLARGMCREPLMAGDVARATYGGDSEVDDSGKDLS